MAQARSPDEIINNPNINYFSAIPNIVDDFPLSVYAYRLYGHIVRRAGQGKNGRCFESVRSMANHCGISVGSVVKAKTELERAHAITRKRIEGQNGNFDHDEITLVDIWENNIQWSKISQEERDQQIAKWRSEWGE